MQDFINDLKLNCTVTSNTHIVKIAVYCISVRVTLLNIGITQLAIFTYTFFLKDLFIKIKPPIIVGGQDIKQRNQQKK